VRRLRGQASGVAEPRIDPPIPFRDPETRGRLKRISDRLRIAMQARLDRQVTPIGESDAFGFVLGCGHSGTTLVASRLGNHPEVALIPEETNLFEPRRPLAAARRRLVAARAEAQAAGRRLVLEKTPKHVRVAGRIRRLLPEARLIVIVRNPLDTCLSLRRRGGTLGEAIDRWCVDNGAALRLEGDPRVRLWHYEELTAAPEPAFRAMLAFLGLPWDPAVLGTDTAYGAAAQKTANMRLRAEQVARPITANSGKWREGLTPGEVAEVRRRTAGLYAGFGRMLPE
jgi:Sulfotransferase family